ncbi:MAG: YceI family protein [Acidobacteria bacterium]|nr:YceI family protein [Acidobacteriota bacterium]MCW5966929.1 YceI family protein [Blastocatellales bacterium]
MRTVLVAAAVVSLLVSLSYSGARAVNNYAVDLGSSIITLTITQDGLLARIRPTNTIAVKSFSGAVIMPLEDESRGSAQLLIEAKSFECIDKDMGEVERRELHSVLHAKILESEKHPQIVFRSAAILDLKRDADTRTFTLHGDLTLHGVTKRVSVPVKLTREGNLLRATGEGVVKQSDFGIAPYSAAFGLIKIRDEVKVTFNVTAKGA